MMYWEQIRADFAELAAMAELLWQALWVPPFTAADAVVVAILSVVALMIILPLWRLLRGRRTASPSVPLSRLTRGPRRLGMTAVLAFFLVFGGWSYYAPLASAAVAPGVVSPDGSRKTVQHLEGGIIRTIHVREGDLVSEGTVLLTLENIRAQARFDELREELIHLSALEARLLAEEQGATEIAFSPPPELAIDAPQQIAMALRGQTDLFQNRRETQMARELILAKRQDQLRAEIVGLNEVIAAQDTQLELLAQEISATQSLYDQGLQRLAPLLTLQRQEADLLAERARNRATIARLDQQIGETELQLLATRQQNREAVSEELSQVRSQLSALRSQLPERADALARTVVTAPIAGEVLNIQVTTETGGVIRPGGDILDIVPSDTALVIDARVRPQDIETVYPGLEAQVLLTAYTQRNLPRIFGTLQSISADRLTDDRTDEPYFLAKVYVDAAQTENIGTDIDLMAGMPADVMILTGERTVLDYLVKPFTDSLRGSFREN